VSNIAIKGATTGTGTFTIESPATNTDRTLTLPDEAGTVLTSGGAIADALNVDSAPTNSLEVDASSNLKFNSGYGSAVTAYGCRAWCNWNSTGTPSIRGSGNVSSLTDNNTGRIGINFSTAMPDANYAVTGMTDGGQTTNPTSMSYDPTYNVSSTTVVGVLTSEGSDSKRDYPINAIAVFR